MFHAWLWIMKSKVPYMANVDCEYSISIGECLCSKYGNLKFPSEKWFVEHTNFILPQGLSCGLIVGIKTPEGKLKYMWISKINIPWGKDAFLKMETCFPQRNVCFQLWKSNISMGGSLCFDVGNGFFHWRSFISIRIKHKHTGDYESFTEWK